MRGPVNHRYLPRGHFTEAPGRDRDEAIRNALAPLAREDREFRAKRVRRLGLNWWSVQYLCASCPRWRVA